MNYNDRKSFLQSKDWRQFRKEIIKRDGSICQCCGTKTKRPKIHHIIQDKGLYDVLIPSYFTTLCKACHDFISAMIPRKNINKKTKDFIISFYR